MLLAAGSAHATPPKAQAKETALPVSIKADAEVSYYIDTDGVSVVTPTSGFAVGDALRGWSVNATYMADIVTAASVDIVASASERWTELRHVVSVGGSYEPVAVRASLSQEPDYTSITGGLSGTHALDDKHVQLRGGYSYMHDIAGRGDTPFSVYALELNRHTFQLGSAFVINRSTELTLSADVALEHGRQEKPYRYLPVFSADAAALIGTGDTVNKVNRLRLPGRMEERVPESRQRFAFTARLARRADAATWMVKERLYADSWSVLASTSDVRYLMDVAKRWVLWTSIRGHLQTGASFHQLAYEAKRIGDGLQLPELRTGDRELSPLAAATFGVGARWDIGDGSRRLAWSLSAQAEGTHTEYFDTLYIDRRHAFLGVLQLQKTLE